MRLGAGFSQSFASLPRCCLLKRTFSISRGRRARVCLTSAALAMFSNGGSLVGAALRRSMKPPRDGASEGCVPGIEII